MRVAKTQRAPQIRHAARPYRTTYLFYFARVGTRYVHFAQDVTHRINTRKILHPFAGAEGCGALKPPGAVFRAVQNTIPSRSQGYRTVIAQLSPEHRTVIAS